MGDSQMQASMSEFVQFLEGRDEGVHQSTENEEPMDPRSPSGREESRGISKQLEDSNNLPPPSTIDELVFEFLGISEAEQNSAATSLCIPRDIVPPGRSAFKPSEPKTYAIDGSNESYGGNWDEGLLENDYDYPCLSSYAHEVVIRTETQSSGNGDKETPDRLVANTSDYSLDVLAQEKLDVQGFQVEEALHMASAPNVMCKNVIDTLQEDSTFFEDMGFDMRNSSELKDCKGYYESSTSEMNAEGSSEDVSPACSNLHIVPMSDGMMDEVTASPPEDFAAPLRGDGSIEMDQTSSPDVAKVPISAEVEHSSSMSHLTCEAVASTSQRPAFDLSSCCGKYGLIVKNQIVLPYSGDSILSENESLDSQDYGMPKLVRADDPPPPVADQIYDSPPELDPVEQPSRKGIKTISCTLASAAGEDLSKSTKKVTLDVVPETIQEATSLEELNDSLGKIVPSFTPDISNQMPAYMNDIYDVRTISLESTSSAPIVSAGGGGSLPLLPVTEEPKVYKTFKKEERISPAKNSRAPDVKSKSSVGVDKGFVRDLLRSVNRGSNLLSGPNCVVEFTNMPHNKLSIRKEVSETHEKRLNSNQSGHTVGALVTNTSTSISTNNVHSASVQPKNTPSVVEARIPKIEFKSLPDLRALLDICGVRSMDKVSSSLGITDGSSVKSSSLIKVFTSEHLSTPRANSASDLSKKTENVNKDITCSTSSSLGKATTVIANVAQEMVNGVWVSVPHTVENMKAKKPAQIKTQDKPVASTSVKVLSKKLISPQEFKVSLPISSLDLKSVKPKDNSDVFLGVRTPTMAQRKQYDVPETESKSSISESPASEKRNDQLLTKTSLKSLLSTPSEVSCGSVEISSILSSSSTQDECSRSKILPKEIIGTIDESTALNQAIRDPTATRSVEKNDDIPLTTAILPQISDKDSLSNEMDYVLSDRLYPKVTNELEGVRSLHVSVKHEKTTNSSSSDINVLDKRNPSNGVDSLTSTSSETNSSSSDVNNSPYKITDTSKSICCVPVSHKSGTSSSQILAHDELEQTDVLKEHPVIEVVNSLIQSSSKLPDLIEDCSEKHETRTALVASVAVERQSKLPSKDVVVKDRTSQSECVTEKSKAKSSLDVVQQRKTTSTRTADSQKVTSSRDSGNKQKNVSSKMEKITSCLRQSSEGKVKISVSEEDTVQQKLVPAHFVVEETTSSSSVHKPKLVSKDGDKNVVNPMSEIGKEKSSTPLSENVDKHKTHSLKTPSALEKVEKSKSALPPPEKRKTRVSQNLTLDAKDTKFKAREVALKQMLPTSKDLSGQSKISLSQNVVEKNIVLQDRVEQQQESSKKNESNVPKHLMPSDTIQKQKIKSTEAADDKSKATSKVDKITPASSRLVVGEAKTISSQCVVDNTNIALSKDPINKTKTASSAVSSVDKRVTKPSQFEVDETQAVSLAVVVEKSKTTSTKSVVDKSFIETSKVGETIPPQDMAATLREKIQGTVDECSSNNSKVVDKKEVSHYDEEVVIERKSVVNKLKSSPNKVPIDKTKKTSSQVDVDKPKEKELHTAGKEIVYTSHEVGKKGAQSKEVTVERKTVVDKQKTESKKVVVDKPKTSVLQNVTEKHTEKVQSTVDKNNIRTNKEIMEKTINIDSKEEVGRRIHISDKSKSALSKVMAKKSKTLPSQDAAEKHRGKFQGTSENESSQTLQEVVEKKQEGARSNEVVDEVKRTVDKPKSASSGILAEKTKKPSSQDLAEKHRGKVQNMTRKESSQILQEVLGKKDGSRSNEVVGEMKPTVNKSKTKSLTAVVDKITRAVAEKHNEKARDMAEKESSSTLQGVVVNTKSAQSNEAFDEVNHTVHKSKSALSKVVVDEKKTTVTQDVVKRQEKVKDVTLQEKGEEKKIVQPNEVVKKIEPTVNKSVAPSSKDMIDKTKLTTTQVVVERNRNDLQDATEEVSTGISQDVDKSSCALPKEVVFERISTLDKPKTVSTKVVIDNTKRTTDNVIEKLEEKVQDEEFPQDLSSVVGKRKTGQVSKVVIDIKALPSKEVTENPESASKSKEVSRKRRAASSGDLVQESKTAHLQDEVEGRKVKPQVVVGLKKSKSSDLLVGMVNSRTTKMVCKARRLSCESIASKKLLKVDKGKNPALGHWRIVRQNKDTAVVNRLPVSQSKINDRAEEQSKPCLRNRSDSSTDRKSSVETYLVSTVIDAKLVENTDKVRIKQCKPAVTEDTKVRVRTLSDSKEEKVRLRTRSETSNERKLKVDGSPNSVVCGGEVDTNKSVPEEVVVSEKRTTKQTKEISSSRESSSIPKDTKEIECSNKLLAKQGKKSSAIDMKSLAETVTEENHLRLRTRSETLVDKKVQDVRNPSNHSMKEPAQNVIESAVTEETNILGGKPTSAAGMVQEETKTRLRTRSETTNEKKLYDSSSPQLTDNDINVSHIESLAKQDKPLLKLANEVANVDVRPARSSRSDSRQEDNKHRIRTRSETSSEKKLKKDNTISCPINQSHKTSETVPKLVDGAGKVSVYDFIDDDDSQSNIHSIDQFRNLSGKSMKNKRSQLVNGALELSVITVEDENKLNSSTRKPRSDSVKVVSRRRSRKSSPKKILVNKDIIVVDKEDIYDEIKSSKSPERGSAEVRKVGGSSLSIENHSGSKEGAATRSRSRDLENDDDLSPARVLRSKMKQTVLNPAVSSVAKHTTNAIDCDSKEEELTSPGITSGQKVKAASKAVPRKPDKVSGSGKWDSTTVDTSFSKHVSALTKNNVQNLGIEDGESSSRRKTRMSTQFGEDSVQESNQLPKDNLLVSQLRLPVSRKTSRSPVILNYEEGSADYCTKQPEHVNPVEEINQPAVQKGLLEDEDRLSNTITLKTVEVGGKLTFIIKKGDSGLLKLRKPGQGDKTDSSKAADSDIVQKSLRETSQADFISKEKVKPIKNTSMDTVCELQPNQASKVSSLDNTVCNAEAVSLKTPPMGTVVSPEPDNIQAVNDMSQHGEPEGAKSSTRTAQLRSLVMPEGVEQDGREQVSFKRDKDRGGKKRLPRERSVLDSKPHISRSLEVLQNKPQNPIVDAPSRGKSVQQPLRCDENVKSSSRNSSPSKTPRSSVLESNKLKTHSITTEAVNENEDNPCRRITRSSLIIASDSSLVKLSKNGDLENDSSRPRRSSNGSLTTSNAIKLNDDTSDSPGLKNQEVLKEAHKQLGKRSQSQLENPESFQDAFSVKPKLRKIEPSVKQNVIKAPIKSKCSSNPDKSVPSPEVVVLMKSVKESKSSDTTSKVQELSDSVEKPVSQSSTAQDRSNTLNKDVPSKADILETSYPFTTMTSDESVKGPPKQQKPEKNASWKKSKTIPPAEKNLLTGLSEIGHKTSVKEVCLASESLDRILREEVVKEVPSSFVVLAQSPGKSPDSTTQSRADIIISKLVQEPLIVNSQKISEDSQGVTSTTEIETLPIMVTETLPSLEPATENHDVGQGKKEDESVSSTTVDSKLCSIAFPDTKFVDRKKKNVLKSTNTSRQSVGESSSASDSQSKRASIEPPISDKTIPESVSKQLNGLNLEVQVVQKQSPSDSSRDSVDLSPEYDVGHPRRKIWRVNPDLNKLSSDRKAVKVQSRENESSNIKSLSDEEWKKTPLKKRQVWVDNNVVKVKQTEGNPRKEDKKTPNESMAIQSTTSSVHHLPHSIFNILSVGTQDKSPPAIQKADSRSVSKEEATRLISERRNVNDKNKTSSRKVKAKRSKKCVTVKRSSCRRRIGLQKSSRLVVSFSQRKLKTMPRKSTKKHLRVKTRSTKNLVDKQPLVSLDVDETVEPTTKYEDPKVLKSLSSDQETIKTTAQQRKLVQNEVVKGVQLNSVTGLHCNEQPVTIHSSLPVTPHTYKELTVDLCEDEEASPQYSPLRPRDQDHISQELPLHAHSGNITPSAPVWSKQSARGGLIVPVAYNTVELINQSTSSEVASCSIECCKEFIPRPIERSHSISNYGPPRPKIEQLRTRSVSQPSIAFSVQTSLPVDLSFHKKRSHSNDSTSHLDQDVLNNPTNIGKLDLSGPDPVFSSLTGDTLTFSLSENKVVCQKPPMNVPMSDHLNNPVSLMNTQMSDELSSPVLPLNEQVNDSDHSPLSPMNVSKSGKLNSLVLPLNNQMNDQDHSPMSPMNTQMSDELGSQVLPLNNRMNDQDHSPMSPMNVPMNGPDHSPLSPMKVPMSDQLNNPMPPLNEQVNDSDHSPLSPMNVSKSDKLNSLVLPMNNQMNDQDHSPMSPMNNQMSDQLQGPMSPKNVPISDQLHSPVSPKNVPISDQLNSTVLPMNNQLNDQDQSSLSPMNVPVSDQLNRPMLPLNNQMNDPGHSPLSPVSDQLHSPVCPKNVPISDQLNSTMLPMNDQSPLSPMNVPVSDQLNRPMLPLNNQMNDPDRSPLSPVSDQLHSPVSPKNVPISDQLYSRMLPMNNQLNDPEHSPLSPMNVPVCDQLNRLMLPLNNQMNDPEHSPLSPISEQLHSPVSPKNVPVSDQLYSPVSPKNGPVSDQLNSPVLPLNNQMNDQDQSPLSPMNVPIHDQLHGPVSPKNVPVSDQLHSPVSPKNVPISEQLNSPMVPLNNRMNDQDQSPLSPLNVAVRDHLHGPVSPKNVPISDQFHSPVSPKNVLLSDQLNVSSNIPILTMSIPNHKVGTEGIASNALLSANDVQSGIRILAPDGSSCKESPPSIYPPVSACLALEGRDASNGSPVGNQHLQVCREPLPPDSTSCIVSSETAPSECHQGGIPLVPLTPLKNQKNVNPSHSFSSASLKISFTNTVSTEKAGRSTDIRANEDVTATLNIAPVNSIRRSEEMTDDLLCTRSKNLKPDRCETLRTQQTDLLLDKRPTPENLCELEKNQKSQEKCDFMANNPISELMRAGTPETWGEHKKGSDHSEITLIVSSASCISSNPVVDNVSPPTARSKGFVDSYPNFIPDVNQSDRAVEEQKIPVTEIESGLNNLPPVTPVVPQLSKPFLPQVDKTTFEVVQKVYDESGISEHAVNTNTATEIQVVNDDIEHQSANKESTVLLPETHSIRLDKTNVDGTSDNNTKTDADIIEFTGIKADTSVTTHDKQLTELAPEPETSAKSVIAIPIENCELSLKPDDQICLNENSLEPAASKIVQSATSFSLTSTKQNLRLPSDQLVPEKLDVCTDDSLSNDPGCHKVDDVESDSNGNETITLVPSPIQSQIQIKVDSDCVNTKEVLEDGEFDVSSNRIHASEPQETMIDVSDKSHRPADSVPLDSASKDACDNLRVGLCSITGSSNPIELTRLCSKVTIEVHQSLKTESKVTEAPEDPITSLTPQNSPEAIELLSVVSNPDSNSSNVSSDPEVSQHILGASLSSSSDSNTNKSVILISSSDSDSKDSFDMGSKSNLNEKDPTQEEGANDERTNNVGSNVVSFSSDRKRKRREDEEDLQSDKSSDSSTFLIEKCKKVQPKVKIRPISPTTMDRIMGSGLKVDHSELQVMVKCWKKYCHPSGSALQTSAVERAESDEVTKKTSRDVKIREKSRTGISRYEDLISRPSTSRDVGAVSFSPFITKRDYKDSKNVSSYLVEREIIRREINRNKKRACVSPSFARDVNIYLRDSAVQNRRIEAIASSSRRPPTIADAMSAITPTRPPIHRSYSRILECLRERRKTLQIIESLVPSCKDFINGISKHTVPGCPTTPRDSLGVAIHSRLSGSDVPPPVTNVSPTNFGAATITVISSDSEDNSPVSTEHVMKDRGEVRKKFRRKFGSFLPSCSCPSPSRNPNSNVCPICRKERNHAQGAASPLRSSSTPLYTKVSDVREPERVTKCAVAVGGGEETVVVPDSDAVHLLKALMTLAGRRPPSCDTPDMTHGPSRSLSYEDPVPTAHSEAFSLPYEKEVLSPQVTAAMDPPFHDLSPHPISEMAGGSSTRCLQQKPASEEAPCLLEGHDANLQLGNCIIVKRHNERGAVPRSRTVPSLHTMTTGSSTSLLSNPASEVVDQTVVGQTAGSTATPTDSQVPPTQLMSAEAEGDSPSTYNRSAEARRILSTIVDSLVTPEIHKEIVRLLSGSEPPSKKRKE